MASSTWILLFCMLLPTATLSQDLGFEVSRLPGKDICGNLDCSFNIAEQKGGKASISRISIYDITHSSKFPLAHRIFGEAALTVDPTKVEDISGTSELTNNRANMQLNLRNPSDCLYETLQCEVEYVDASGRKQVVRKTVAPETPDVNDDCSCSSITYRLDRLTNQAEGAARKTRGQKLNLDNLEINLDRIQNGTTDVEEDVARLQESHANIFVALDELRAEGRVFERQTNELGHNDSVLQANIDEIQAVQTDTKETILAYTERDKETFRILYQLNRNKDGQGNAFGSLRRSDGVIQESFNDLDQTNLDLKQSLNDVENRSSSLANIINALSANDDNLKRDTDVQAAEDVKVQAQIRDYDNVDSVIDKELVKLNSNNLDLKEEAAQQKQSTDAKKDEVNELNKKYNKLEAKQATLIQNDKVIDDRVAAANSRDSKLNTDFTGLLEADINLRQEVDKLKDRRDVQQQTTDKFRQTDTAQGLQLADLAVTDRVIEQQINDVEDQNSDIRGELDAINNYYQNIRELLDSVINELELVQSQINTTRISTQTKTTASLVLKTCTRGMPHEKPRAPVMLFGAVPTLCDTETDGGGWFLIERRVGGNENFIRDWDDYKRGFGSPDGDFYIGNDNIFRLTSEGYHEVRFDFKDARGRSTYAHYTDFSIGDESSGYRLHASGYEGTAGNSLSGLEGMKFRTRDRLNCPNRQLGGWWYRDCEPGLNGPWGVDDGAVWDTLDHHHSVTYVEVKIRLSSS